MATKTIQANHSKNLQNATIKNVLQVDVSLQRVLVENLKQFLHSGNLEEKIDLKTPFSFAWTVEDLNVFEIFDIHLQGF